MKSIWTRIRDTESRSNDERHSENEDNGVKLMSFKSLSHYFMTVGFGF